MSSVVEGTLLWEPSAAMQQQSTLVAYLEWLRQHRGVHHTTYDDVWHWSVTELDAFWASLWDFFQIASAQPYDAVLANRTMPGAVWFPGARINFAEHVFRNMTTSRPALMVCAEGKPPTELSWHDLQHQVAAVAAALRAMGVVPGDRVVGYLPNIPEAVIIFLACASIGAIWSSCSPDFGAASVIDRFKQIDPKVLFVVNGYVYQGKSYDRRTVAYDLQRALPSLQQTVLISPTPWEWPVRTLERTVFWSEILAIPGDLRFESLPFDHPLWILYSSGTTGLPKPIVQSQGGIMLELLKALAIQLDIKPTDRFFWFTTTGWMMWNFLVGGLLVGSTIVLYDGSPAYPNIHALWDVVEETKVTVFGAGAPYILTCMKQEISPKLTHRLDHLRILGSTAAPLSPAGFQWVYEHVKADVLLSSISGGTDVCTAFVGGCPLLPVTAGEIACRWLGAKVEAFDPHGNPLRDEVGELVITEPMPSMPLFFWNDPDHRRYRESYFETYPGVWRHGDWIKITSQGRIVISGRSDSTIKRQGVRIGTSEIYRVLDEIPEIVDSLVIDIETNENVPYMPLFVVLAPGAVLDDTLQERIRGKIRIALSPRHVPDDILTIPEVPRTLSGKKLEVPIKRILRGEPMERVLSPDSLQNPHALTPFVALARRLGAQSAKG